MSKETSTIERIHKAAKAEFLEKGFLTASLRNIVKNAGVTTGAFYGYYKSKEELLAAVVGNEADYVLNFVKSGIDEFMERPTERQTKEMVDYTKDAYLELLDYLYEHLEEFKIILTASEGTRYSTFLHEIAEEEARSSFEFIEQLRDAGYNIASVPPNLIHMISSAFVSGVFEVVIHNMPKNDARDYIGKLREFYTAGWEQLIGVDFGL